MDCNEKKTNNINIEDLIIKHIDGELSDCEAEKLKTWVDSSVDNRKLYIDYVSMIEADRISQYESLFEKDKQLVWKKLLRRIYVSKQKRTNSYYLFLKYAAVIVISISLTYYFLEKSKRETALDTFYTVEVPLGSKTQLLLPDSSSVWLNAGTSISYDRDFGIKNRDIKLSGEAYFNVRKNTAIPFRVEIEKLNIEVLGTKFNVKSYLEDVSNRITLLEGSLEVYLTDNLKSKVRIKPDQQVLYSKGEKHLSIKKVRATEFTSWMLPQTPSVRSSTLSGLSLTSKSSFPSACETMVHNLFFDEETLGQIIRDLERAFDIRISVDDSIPLNYKYYGDFRNGESLEEILSVLCKKQRMSYTINNREVYIKRK